MAHNGTVQYETLPLFLRGSYALVLDPTKIGPLAYPGPRVAEQDQNLVPSRNL